MRSARAVTGFAAVFICRVSRNGFLGVDGFPIALVTVAMTGSAGFGSYVTVAAPRILLTNDGCGHDQHQNENRRKEDPFFLHLHDRSTLCATSRLLLRRHISRPRSGKAEHFEIRSLKSLLIENTAK